MGSGKGKSKGGRGPSVSSKLPTISSREDLDRAIKDASTNATDFNKKGHLIILKFTANWCSVCKQISPFGEGLANDPKIATTLNRNVVLYDVDVDESPDLTNFYGASALPLFVFLVDGKKVDTMVGAQQTALKKKILKHASSKK
jgi:thiol-disulfide isomerase/thioredoxin